MSKAFSRLGFQVLAVDSVKAQAVHSSLPGFGLVKATELEAHFGIRAG